MVLLRAPWLLGLITNQFSTVSLLFPDQLDDFFFWSHQLQRGKEATIHLRNNKNNVCYKQKTQKMEMTMEEKLLYLQFVTHGPNQ